MEYKIKIQMKVSETYSFNRQFRRWWILTALHYHV